MEHANYIVLSGCSGGGKSSVLVALKRRGYAVFYEPFLEIVKEQELVKKREQLLAERELFAELVLSRCLYNFKKTNTSGELVFFDRGIIDAVHSNTKNSPHFDLAAQKLKYYNKVFFFPPWQEIYQQDSYRKHDFIRASNDYDKLKKAYLKYGYKLIDMPKVSVDERVDFVLENLTTVSV